MGLPGGPDCKEPAYLAGDLGSIPGLGNLGSIPGLGDLGSVPGLGDLGSIPGEWNVYPLQYPCLENSMNRRLYWATLWGSQRVRHE